MHNNKFSNYVLAANNHDNETDIVSFDNWKKSFHIHTYNINLTFVDHLPIYVVLYNCLLVFTCSYDAFLQCILNIKINSKSLSL